MTNEEMFFIDKIVKLNANKVCDSFLEDLKETYRYAIKTGNRSVFVKQAKENAEILNNMNLEELFKFAGLKMFILAELLSEYVDFQKWLSTMIGEPLIKKEILFS